LKLKKMDRLGVWAKGRPLGLVMIAQQAAVGAEGCFEFVKLTMAGENVRTVQTLLGHKDLRMTMRYSHLSPEHLREAVENLEKSLKPTSNVLDQVSL